jgi:hypothetical protein
MKKIFVLMSHNLNEDQIADLKNMEYTPVFPSETLAKQCSRIDPKATTYQIHELARLVSDEINEADAHAVLVMGELSLCFNVIVNLTVPAYVATTDRIVETVLNDDGSETKISRFKHVQFRMI